MNQYKVEPSLDSNTISGCYLSFALVYIYSATKVLGHFCYLNNVFNFHHINMQLGNSERLGNSLSDDIT